MVFLNYKTIDAMHWLQLQFSNGITDCRYKLGFCPNGPDCRYRHAKQPGPPPPVEEVLQKIQQLTSYNYSASNKFFQQRNSNFSQQADRSQFPQGAISANQAAVSKPTASESNIQQQPIQAGQDQTQNPASNLSNQPGGTATPLPQGITRCVQSVKAFSLAYDNCMMSFILFKMLCFYKLYL